MKHTPPAGQVSPATCITPVVAGGRKDTPNYERPRRTRVAACRPKGKERRLAVRPPARSRPCRGTQRAPRTQFKREGRTRVLEPMRRGGNGVFDAATQR